MIICIFFYLVFLIFLKTEEEVEQRRTGADNYAREVLFALEERVSDTLSQVRGGIDMLDKNDSGIKDTN